MNGSDDDLPRGDERAADARGPASERGEKPERTEKPERETLRERDERRRSERDDRDDTLGETIRQKLEQLVPDLVKKTFSAGMGAVFQTEEGIRRVVGGARDSLPEVAGYIASSADGAKDKVFEIVARETREFLSNLNLTEEIAKILTTLSFEIKTEVRFIPNSERITGAVPDVKASVRLKRNEPEPKSERTGERAEHTDGKRDKDDEPANRDSRSRLRFWRRDGEEAPDEGEDHDK